MRLLFFLTKSKLLCQVTDNLRVYEELLGLYNVNSINATTLTDAFKDVFERLS